MDEDEYENYSDDDFLAELKQYEADVNAENAQDDAEKRQQIAEMVGGYMGLWWYLRGLSAMTSRSVRTYAAVADRQAKFEAWRQAEQRRRGFDNIGSFDTKVRIVNEFGACSKCLPYVGNVYSMDGAKELVPFHHNCRCTLVRVEDDFDKIMAGATAALTQSELAKQKQEDDDQLLAAQERVDEMVERGILSPLTTAADYLKYKGAIESMIGLKTVDGRLVQEYANHFVERVIGGGWQNQKTVPWKGRRSGVEIKDIVDTLEKGTALPNSVDKNQILYVSDVARVVYNIDSGKLVSVYPQ